MRMYDLIYAKKMGRELSPEQIHDWIRSVTDGSVPDEQSAALLMAICLKGMTSAETSALTLAMRDSGARVDLASVPGLKIDKHSTGGVGDKTTLILGPIVAACGRGQSLTCAMFSGRGLGHTGGTIDKFSAIPGMRVELSLEEFRNSLLRTGFANSAQTSDICPADRKLYALRDITATVESIPLITASIMSKKLAGGADALVLDVKCGSGAFMKSVEDARLLTQSMLAVGRSSGLKIRALITRMEEPLGWAIGNALEIMEVVEILKGAQPESNLSRMSFRLAAEMLLLGQAANTLDEALAQVQRAVSSGEAMQVLRDFVALHGGDASALDDFSRLPHTSRTFQISSETEGFVHSMDGRALGILAMEQGAGRRFKEDRLDLGAGIQLHKQVGDFVEKGETLFTVHTEHPQKIATSSFLEALRIAPEPAPRQPWLIESLS